MAAAPALARRSWWRRHAGPVLVFGLVTAVSFLSLMIAGVNKADESWNLHLIDRMLVGDVLYTDIRYFPTPLALFVGLGAAAVFGVQLAVLKAVMAVSFGITATANLFIARRLSAGRRAQVLLVVALLLFALPPPSSLYNTLVISLTSVTAALVLRWDGVLNDPPDPRRSRRLFRLTTAIGIAAGACILAKYNIGAAVVLATAGSFAVPLVQRRIRLRDFLAGGLTAAVACLLTVLAGLAPVLLQGAGGDFVRQLLDGSTLIDAPVPYLYFWQRLVDGVANWSTLAIRNFSSYGLVPISGLVAVVAIARTRSIIRARLIIVLLFCLASAFMAFPRADHMPWVVPLPLAMLIGSATQVLKPLKAVRPALAAAVGSLSLGFALTWLCLAIYLEIAEARRLEMIRTGHFQGVLVPPGQWRAAIEEAAELRGRVGADRKVLVLRLEAGFYYLAADLKNPTRYHYPDAYEFGDVGVAEVKKALLNHTIPFTCIGRDYPPELEPARVIATVKAHAYLMARLRACDLWRTGSDPQRRPS